MSLDDDVPDGAVVVARVQILRFLTDEHDIVIYSAVDSAGADLPLVESLGMLRLTEDTVIRERMAGGGGNVDPDDDD